MRADQFVANTLNISRSKANELIKNQQIKINDKFISKSSDEIKNLQSKISCESEIFVSRGAIKLKGFLQELRTKFELNLSDKTALDIGSSTGGFVQILLQNGVKSVTALDVGNNQLSDILRDDDRVIVRENTDIRDFKSTPFDIITADVSFISLGHILPCIDRLAKNDIILLFKPQFEAGIDAKRDKNGVLKDQKALNLAKNEFEQICLNLGWRLKFSSLCVIKGKNGNQERFYYYDKK